MNRTLKFALSAVLSAAIAVPVFAQDANFPDVKESHWAADALVRMKKEGILVGYPDGLYHGSRPASRYELAVAINAAYTNLKAITDGLSTKIDDLTNQLNDMKGKGVSQADLDALKQALDDLKSQVDGMKSYGQDIDDLKKMADKFEKELAAMGVNVDDMQKGLSSLEKRVTALEARKLPVDIHGDANIVGIGGYSQSGGYGVDLTGRPEGFGRFSEVAGKSGIDQDVTVLHELAVDLTTTNDKGPKGHITLVEGNMMSDGAHSQDLGALINGQAFGNMSTIPSGSPYYEGEEAAYFQKMEVTFDESVAGLGFSGNVGRIGMKISPYIFWRPDTTPYFVNDRWDNGEYDVDGANLGFRFGGGSGVKVNVFAARTSDQTSTNGMEVQPLIAGQGLAYADGGARPIGFSGQLAQIDQMVGATAWIPLGKDGSVDLAYVLLDSDTFFGDASFNGAANRIAVYGGDLNFNWQNFKVEGGYSKSDVFFNTHSLLTANNQRADGYIGWDNGTWGLKGGYRYIEPYYGAPGYWGRIGMWWNPTNIQGADVRAHVNLGHQLDLHGSYEYYTGTGKAVGGLTHDDKVQRAYAALGYKFGSSSGVDLGFEQVMWDITGQTAEPYERWYDIGFNYDFTKDSMFSIMWQISDYNAKGQPGFGLFGQYGTPQNTSRGGLITTQFSLKF